MFSYVKYVTPAAALAIGLSGFALQASAGEIESRDVQKVEKAETHKVEVQKPEVQKPEVQRPERPDRIERAHR